MVNRRAPSRGGLAAAAESVRRAGRRGDTVLAHISPAEARHMDRLQGGPSINPQTGAREYFSLGGFGAGLARAAGGIVGNIVGGPIGAAIGSAAATALTGGDLAESATNGILGGLGAYMSSGSWGAGGLDLGLGTESLFGSLSGSSLPAGGVHGGMVAPSFGDQLWNGLTSGSGLAALGVGGLLMSPSSKPRVPTSPTAGGNGNDVSDDRVNIDVEPFNRQHRGIGRDPYSYGETGGESQMFDVVNPSPVFRARGGRVKGDTIPGARWKSQGLGRYADGGTVLPRDYYELERPAETYDTEGEHKFFGDQRFADIAIGGLSDSGTPRTPTNPGGGSTGIPNEYGGKGSGLSPPSASEFSVNDPSRAAAQLSAAEEGIGVLGAMGFPGIGIATGIVGALSDMGVHGVLSPPDVSEYDEGARQAHQAAIDDAADKNKDIPIGDIAIGALAGAINGLAPPGVDLAESLGIGVGGSPAAGSAVGPSGVGGSVGAPAGTPGSGDIGTVGGTSEAGPGVGGNPGAAAGGGGGVGGDMSGGSGGVTGGTGQPGSPDGPGIWRTGGKVRRYAQGGLAERLRTYSPFQPGQGSPPPAGSGGASGDGSSPPLGAPASNRLRANLGRIQRLAEGGQPNLPTYGSGPMWQFFRDRMGQPGTPDAGQTGGQGGAPALGALGDWLRQRIGPMDGSRLPEPARNALTGFYQRLGGQGAWEPGAIYRQLAQRANPRGYDMLQRLSSHLRPARQEQPDQPLAGGGRPRGMVKGPGDGQSDDIPAMLSDGEYVMDAETVSALGDGSNDAGAKRLDEMRERLRAHKRGAAHSSIPPKAKPPEGYLKGGAKKRGGKKPPKEK